MRTKFLPVAAAVLSLVGFTAPVLAQTNDTSKLLQEAQRAYIGGNTTVAKEKFEAVLAVDPKNSTALRYYKSILAKEKQSQSGGLQGQLNATKLPSVNLKDVSLDAVLEYLTAQTAKATNNSLQLSFVQKLPQDYAQSTRISLSLQGAPLSEILRYVGELSGTQFRVDKYAIVVEPAGSKPAANGAADPQKPAEPTIPGL